MNHGYRHTFIGCSTLLAASLVHCGIDGPGSAVLPRGSSDEAAERAFPERHGALRTGTLPTEGGPRGIAYEEIDGLAVIEGDILFPLESITPSDVREGEGVARTVAASRWPDGVVPYSIDPALPSPARVTDAIAHWHANTTLRFIARTTQANYVRFRNGSGCSSSVGMIGGVQYVNLADSCSTGNAIHEIGHAVGLWHEHTRADRSSYVTIHLENVQSGTEHNFQTYIERDGDGIDAGLYDYGSIMHYGRTAFSSNGRDTITPLDPSAIIGQRTRLSARDIAAVTFLYQELNRDRPGADFSSFDLTEARPELCRAACARNNRCQAHTYVRPGFQGPSARCWLKSAVPVQVTNNACISGVRGALETNQDRPGQDYRAFDLSAPDPLLCRDACAREAACLSFTYVRPGVQGPSARCWLKGGVPGLVANSNTVSGVKRGLEHNTDRSGSDYRSFDLSTANPRVCQATCAAESACQAFTYVEPGLQGPNARCWLKSRIPAATFNGRTISGVKGLDF